MIYLPAVVIGVVVATVVSDIVDVSPVKAYLKTLFPFSVFSMQGRNFCLKSGVPIQKENEAPSGPEARGDENGEEVSPLHPTLGSERAS